MKDAISIKDVASTLGISVSTVSRVINGQDRVSSEMRKKVTDTVRKLNYVPSYAAVSIVKKQTRLIAVLVPDLFTPFCASVVQGIEEVARKNKYYTMVVATGGRRHEEADFISSMMGRSVDGVAIIPSSSDLSYLKGYAKPLVLLDRTDGDGEYDSVVTDNFRGAYIAAEHLISSGHKKIAIISGEKTMNIGHERYWGFAQAMQDKGLSIKTEYECFGGWTEKDGYENAFRLLHVADPPTAIFAAGADICRGVILAVHDLRLRLAKDISLIAFEDCDMARMSSPEVSVVCGPVHEMGRIGARILLDKLAANTGPYTCQKISLPVKLITRGSVKEIG